MFSIRAYDLERLGQQEAESQVGITFARAGVSTKFDLYSTQFNNRVAIPGPGESKICKSESELKTAPCFIGSDRSLAARHLAMLLHLIGTV